MKSVAPVAIGVLSVESESSRDALQPFSPNVKLAGPRALSAPRLAVVSSPGNLSRASWVFYYTMVLPILWYRLGVRGQMQAVRACSEAARAVA